MGVKRIHSRDDGTLLGADVSWRIWAKALGEKASKDNKEADKVAILRTCFVVLTVITEVHIILNFWMTHG